MGKGFGSPVSCWMVSPVLGVRENERLESVQRLLEERDISAVPVLDASGRPSGVISRTDLLTIGRRTSTADRSRTLTLPDEAVRHHAQHTVEVVSADAPLSQCAKRMLDRRYHRLYVAQNGHLLGVVSTREMMDAVAEGRVKLPLADIMSSSLIYVRAGDPISLAVDRLAAAHKSGIVVMDDGWPVGVFSQAEALACRGVDPGDPVERWMSLRVLCLPSSLPCYRAAAQACAIGVRRLIVMDDQRSVGIVSGLDFARVVKNA